MIATVSSRSPLAHRAYHSDRRAQVRLTPSAVPWLRGARLRYGCHVHVIDISKTGILVESQQPFKAGAALVLELIGTTSTVVVAARVVRCRETFVRDQLWYRAACSFTTPLSMPLADREMATGASESRQTVDSIIDALEFGPWTDASAGDNPRATQTGWQKIVVKYRNGRLLRGYTNNFNASRSQLHVSNQPHHGKPLFVPVGQLKAIFFVRTFEGDPRYVDSTTFCSPARGKKLEVTFHDNEALVGSTLSYRHDGEGFFVYPADPNSNNMRVFVVRGAVKHIKVL